MKQQFIGYYRPTQDEFHSLWQEATFVFDTNILLNFYRYTPTARNNLFEILARFSERIWVPHQVGLEFHQRRIEVIGKLTNVYDEIERLFSALENTIRGIERRHPSVVEITQALDGILNAFPEVRELLSTLRMEQPDYLSDDPILERITELFEQKVGNPYTEDIHLEKVDKAQKRFTEKVPPGYMDGGKVGDMLLWFQTMDYSATHNKSVILVTDDKKEDWWQKVQGRTLGPRVELIEEFIRHTNQRIWMYTPERFQEYAVNFLGIAIPPETQEEIQDEIRTKDTMGRAKRWVEEADKYLQSLPAESQVQLPHLIAGTIDDDLFIDNAWVHLSASDVSSILAKFLRNFRGFFSPIIGVHLNAYLIEYESTWLCRLENLGSTAVVDVPKHYWRETRTSDVLEQVYSFLRTNAMPTLLRTAIDSVPYLFLDRPNAIPTYKTSEAIQALLSSPEVNVTYLAI